MIGCSFANIQNLILFPEVMTKQVKRLAYFHLISLGQTDSVNADYLDSSFIHLDICLIFICIYAYYFFCICLYSFNYLFLNRYIFGGGLG